MVRQVHRVLVLYLKRNSGIYLHLVLILLADLGLILSHQVFRLVSIFGDASHLQCQMALLSILMLFIVQCLVELLAM